MKRFTGKSVIITGGGSGLGRAAALQIAKEEGRLALVDVDEAGLADSEKAIREAAPDAEVLLLTANVADEAQVAKYVDDTVKRFGSIDGFFNNAGIEGKQNPTEEFGSNEFAKVLAVDLNGVFYGLKHVLKVMRKQGSGSVVNTTSVGGIRALGNQSGYAAAKHGVVGLTRNSAIEYGQYGIQVNAIAPGPIMTPMVEGSLRQMNPDDWEAAGAEVMRPNPMQRFGTTEELGHLVAFLLSGDSRYVNGQVIAIDGGQSSKY